MLEMIADLTKAENGIYILWGIAFLGLMLKMISNAYVKMFMRRTENMATVRKKKLRVMRQKYENRKSMGMEGSSGDFVEKNIRDFRFMGVPFDALGRHINIGVYATVIVTAGAFLLYEPSWRGSPSMVTFLANSVIVCAFLMSLENIFLTRTKLEIMKANIRDYLDNMSVRGRQGGGTAKSGYAGGVPDCAGGEMRGDDALGMPVTGDGTLKSNAKRSRSGVHRSGVAGTRKRDEEVLAVAESAAMEEVLVEGVAKKEEKPPDAGEISLDGFLKEFFS